MLSDANTTAQLALAVGENKGDSLLRDLGDIAVASHKRAATVHQRGEDFLAKRPRREEHATAASLEAVFPESPGESYKS